MDLSPKRFADTMVVFPVGRIDLANYEEFKAALWPHVDSCRVGGDALVLDLSGVDYISSAGLLALMLASKQITSQGGALVITGLQPFVREVFEVSRFSALLDIAPSTRAALARISPTALAAFDAA
ncbi:MAG TPA: STAS domain-containing protein [Candidatus Binatia bacterium]|nr:STAS domain-containing protein [Candidatus Binatia bacterium]